MCKVTVYNFVQGLFVYWEVVKMAKRNNVINFAVKRRQKRRKTELKRKYQNKTVNEKDIKRYRRAAIILAVAAFLLMVIEVVIALALGEMSSLFSSWAEALKSILVGMIAILDVILFWIGEKKGDVRNRYVTICIFIFVVFMLFVVSFLDLLGFAIDDRVETVAEADSPIPIKIEVSGEYQKEVYSAKEDIFIERLERYYGVEEGSIPQEETVDKMAILIERELSNSVNIQVNITIPQSYTDNCFIADILYGFYNDNNEMLKEDYSDYVITELGKNILDNLKKAKDYRELADRAHEDSTNQRLIGLYCIDLSDEYLRTGDIVSAEDELLDAANWAIKSIITAAAKGNQKQMKSALKVLESAEERLSDLQDKIGDSSIQKVKNCLEAYSIVVDNWEVKQQ